MIVVLVKYMSVVRLPSLPISKQSPFGRNYLLFLLFFYRLPEARSCPVTPRDVFHRRALVSWQRSLRIPLRSAVQLSRYKEKYILTLQRECQGKSATGENREIVLLTFLRTSQRQKSGCNFRVYRKFKFRFEKSSLPISKKTPIGQNFLRYLKISLPFTRSPFLPRHSTRRISQTRARIMAALPVYPSSVGYSVFKVQNVRSLSDPLPHVFGVKNDNIFSCS